jgi:peptidoglycan/LPS O-acetylase OafA/YrhL
VEQPVLRPADHGRVVNIRQLTGIRALAAGWVLAFHFRVELVTEFSFLGPTLPVINAGYLGVDLFFVLSGFILAYTHLHRLGDRWTPTRAAGFLWLRVARIWPVMVVTLLAAGLYHLALLLATGSGEHADALDPGRLATHLLLIDGWGRRLPDWNPVAWSLSEEWMAYLAFAATAALLLRACAQLTARALALGALAAVLPVTVTGMAMRDGANLMFSNHGTLLSGIVPLRVLGEFLAGVLIAQLTARQRTTGRVAVAIPLLVLLIWSLARCPGDPLARLLATRPLEWSGRTSFALYMCHFLVLQSYRTVAGHLPVLPRRALLIACVGAPVVLAYLLYRFVEEPARHRLRAMLPRSADG